ncbi:hypothetical protein DPMN_077269 [Dreissena polymorpha]|uniref:Uncharacterized protein n=1 Tax=Dreissena polymorpha TaxID=45954 RepID=A0A9D4BP68_DREPO|nr:hypothetical protein DPMN_077269 [Dreissena polymorpha]
MAIVAFAESCAQTKGKHRAGYAPATQSCSSRWTGHEEPVTWLAVCGICLHI